MVDFLTPNNYVMKRYLTAGPLHGTQSSSGPEYAKITGIWYTPFGCLKPKLIQLDPPLPAEEGPYANDIVVEFPTHVIWCHVDHFDDQFSKV